MQKTTALPADSDGSTGYGVGQQPLDCWDEEFDTRWGHECSSFVFAVCCVGSGFCDQLITHSEESYSVCVSVRFRNPKKRQPTPNLGYSSIGNESCRLQWRRCMMSHYGKNIPWCSRTPAEKHIWISGVRSSRGLEKSAQWASRFVLLANYWGEVKSTMTTCAENVVRMGRKINTCMILVGNKTRRNTPLGRTMCSWELNIGMVLKEENGNVD